MENKEQKDLEKARDLSIKLLSVLKVEDADYTVTDMAMTRLLAGLYSLHSPEIAEKLITLHCDNLRYSVREICETRNFMS